MTNKVRSSTERLVGRGTVKKFPGGYKIDNSEVSIKRQKKATLLDLFSFAFSANRLL